MAEANYRYEEHFFQLTAGGNYSKGQVIQLPNGEAGFFDDIAATSGDPTQARRRRVARVDKTAGIVILKGGEVYWDHSANAAHYKRVNDRDFFVGCATGTTTSTSTEVEVILNQRPVWDIDVFHDPILRPVIVGTQGLNTMGVVRQGGNASFILSSTSEAQKMDIMSVAGFTPTTAKAIIEMQFCVISNGAGTNTDVSIGAASATSATDADAIAEHLFMHLNAEADLNVYLQSKDGSTTVTATDTTIDYAEGGAVAQQVHVWMDMANPADVQCYVNGALVNDATAFNVNAAAATWFLLAHIEKASSADVYEFRLDKLRARFNEQ